MDFVDTHKQELVKLSSENLRRDLFKIVTVMNLLTIVTNYVGKYIHKPGRKLCNFV